MAIENQDRSKLQHMLTVANLPLDLIMQWLDMQADLASLIGKITDHHLLWNTVSPFFQAGQALLRCLPPKLSRTTAENAGASLIQECSRDARANFLRVHAEQVYATLTDNYGSFVRVSALVSLAGELYPDLVPGQAEIAVEESLPQSQKEGIAMDQGIFIAEILKSPRAGAHLIQAMQRPKDESLDRLVSFQRNGIADLGAARVERHGSVGYLYHVNNRYLNAEDELTSQALETGVDLILLDPQIEVGIIRGDVVDHPKHRGRRVFNAGLNLTHLYEGRISFLFFITRELGYLNKIYRGLVVDQVGQLTTDSACEKPWIGVVEGFAVGGGCQLLLVLDHVLAEADSFFALPAADEGIIPGVANLRLTRFLGGRLARRFILFGEKIAADSPTGSLLCDVIVPTGMMEDAIERAATQVIRSGLISMSNNRRLLRSGEEPLSAFQAYMADFAQAQALCYVSPSLIRNLEDSWLARRMNKLP